MAIAIEIIRTHDLDDDHEVGGQDLPFEYTAIVRGGSVTDAIALMEAGCGQFRAVQAFNIEQTSVDEVTFRSFDTCCASRFEWPDALERELLKTSIDGKVFHYILRRHHLALMATVEPKLSYLRGFWWDRVHPDPGLPPTLDKLGHRVQPGQYCRFETTKNSHREAGTGWIWQVSANREYPIAIWQDNAPEASFGLGLTPNEVEVLDDDKELQAITSMLSAGALPRDPRNWIENSLRRLPEDGHMSMRSDEKARWAEQFPQLRAQYTSLENLILSYRTQP